MYPTHPQSSSSHPPDPQAATAALRILIVYLVVVSFLFWGCYVVLELIGIGHVDIVTILLIKMALIVAASAYFIHRRTFHAGMRDQRRVQDLVGSRIELVERLACAAEYRDDATGLHNRRIGLYAQAVARRLGLTETERDLLAQAAVLHDVGKIGVPDSVLLKPGPLDPQERAAMERHAVIGGTLLAGSSDPLLEMAHRIALTHHENWNGSGYPRGLQGDSIPLEARIVSVCDVFDALTTARPYKTAWTPEDAMEEIRRLSGTKFDPAVVTAFFSVEKEIREAFTDVSEGPWSRYRSTESVNCRLLM